MAHSSPQLANWARQLDRFSSFLGHAIAWLTFVMMVVMTLVVILRYGFNLGWIAMQESVLYLHAFVLMLGMGYTLKTDEHVRVDIFYRRFSAQKQNRVNLFGHILFLIPTCLFVLFMSWDYVFQSWQILEQSQEAGGLPLVFLLKTLLILMPLLLIFQALSEIIKILATNKVEGA